MLAETKVDRSVLVVEDQLRNATTILNKREREILSNFNITPPQAGALSTLLEYGELTMGELCAKLYLACSTATDLVDRMERNGFIERLRDKNDRRVIRLRVLAKGTATLDEVLAARRTYLAGALREVNLADKERLIQSLEHLHYSLTRTPANPLAHAIEA
jgi:DNA-binding MarR family transcriptional regulator